MDAIGEALIGENDAMEQFCKACGGMASAKVVNAEFEEIRLHLDDLLQWIELVERCAEAAGYPVAPMGCTDLPYQHNKALKAARSPTGLPRCLRRPLVCIDGG
jgi:hypothetical protein